MELKLVDNYTVDYNAYDEEFFVFSYDDNDLDNLHIEKSIINFCNDRKNECKKHFKELTLDINARRLIFNYNFKHSNRDEYIDWFDFVNDFDESNTDVWFEHTKNQSKMIIMCAG
jgi:hypothetical protein